MAKTDITREIERALRYYSPRELGGIHINTFRGRATAFEVPVECGTNVGGMVDCVRVNEYFGDLQYPRCCSAFSWRKDVSDYGLRQFKECCTKRLTAPKEAPRYCEESACRLCRVTTQGTPKVLIQCFEIKVTRSDFKSKNGHNHVGHLNYYVVPKELYEAIKDDVPDGVGIIIYSDSTQSLRRKRDAAYRAMTDEEQMWMVLNVLKRVRRTRDNEDASLVEITVEDRDDGTIHRVGESEYDSLYVEDGAVQYFNLRTGCGTTPDGNGTYRFIDQARKEASWWQMA